MLVLGLSYKADIDDDRESPSYEIIELLRERGAEVAYCDPYFPAARAGAARPGAGVGPLHRRGVRPLRLRGGVDGPPGVRRPRPVPPAQAGGRHAQRGPVRMGAAADQGLTGYRGRPTRADACSRHCSRSARLPGEVLGLFGPDTPRRPGEPIHPRGGLVADDPAMMVWWTSAVFLIAVATATVLPLSSAQKRASMAMLEAIPEAANCLRSRRSMRMLVRRRLERSALARRSSARLEMTMRSS